MLDPVDCLHAVGQGALAIEVRENDDYMQKIVQELHHRPTTMACIAERAFMKRLEGGCSAPVAAHAECIGSTLVLDGGVWSLDGKESLRKQKVNKSSEFKMTHHAPVNRWSLFSSMVSVVGSAYFVYWALTLACYFRTLCMKIMTTYSAVAWWVKSRNHS